MHSSIEEFPSYSNRLDTLNVDGDESIGDNYDKENENDGNDTLDVIPKMCSFTTHDLSDNNTFNTLDM